MGCIGSKVFFDFFFFIFTRPLRPLGHPDAYDSSTNFVHVIVYICMALNKTKNGLVRDLNPGPLAP